KQAVDDTFRLVESPPGRKPDKELLALATWYQNQTATDKHFIQMLAKLTSDLALFGIMAVLDGVRVIEDDPDRGKLKLYYETESETQLLNDPTGPFLHDLIH